MTKKAGKMRSEIPPDRETVFGFPIDGEWMRVHIDSGGANFGFVPDELLEFVLLTDGVTFRLCTWTDFIVDIAADYTKVEKFTHWIPINP